jgi:multidrug efflux system membrane fusion protein
LNTRAAELGRMGRGVFTGLCVMLAVAAGCERQEQAKGPAGPPTVPVSVAKAETRDVPIQLRSVGNVESIAAVMLRPQVAGQVLATPAGEGRDVKAGEVVVTIDPRPFEAALREAEASLARNTVIAIDERRGAQQLRTAYEGRAVAVREVEQAEARAAAAEAQAAQDAAAVETVKLQLLYCTITAPFDGRLGALLVKPGAIVKANETDLIHLTQVAPIDVSFTVREQDLAQVRAAQAAQPLTVFAEVPGAGEPVEGVLSFIDNRVDPATGAIRLKARFENADQRLWTGQFVNVTMTVGVDEGATVVPSSAVQASQRGRAVFVVKADGTAEQRPVEVRRSEDGLTVIASGLAPGETVVTEGQLRLTQGAKVSVREQRTPRAAEVGEGS